MSTQHSNNDHNDIAMMMETMGQRARKAARTLAEASDEVKNIALHAAATAIRKAKATIQTENAKDMEAARIAGLDKAKLDRLLLNDGRIEAMAQGLEAIAELKDPVGNILAAWDRPNGLKISRVTVPLGVIGIIYESRPNVTADAGGLCIKSGNTAILRGGSESIHSSTAITQCLHQGLKAAGLDEDCIQSIPVADRNAVGVMLQMSRYIDVIIPRGGKGLIQRIIEDSRIPTLQHLDGNCHSYIHSSANKEKAIDIVVNAKMRRTAICGATESLVIDAAVKDSILPGLIDALDQHGCELRGDKHICAIDSRIKTATTEDYDTEYLDSILSIKMVDSCAEAIDFINTHSSHHTDAIITEDKEAAAEFLRKIDSAIVMHNASTQFADGGEFGMGAEIGIATGRLHARGPVGVEQLTTFKYVVEGDGHTRPKG